MHFSSLSKLFKQKYLLSFQLQTTEERGSRPCVEIQTQSQTNAGSIDVLALWQMLCRCCSELEGLAGTQSLWTLERKEDRRKEAFKGWENGRRRAKENHRSQPPVSVLSEGTTVTSAASTSHAWRLRRRKLGKATGSGWTWVWHGHFQMSDLMLVSDICQRGGWATSKPLLQLAFLSLLQRLQSNEGIQTVVGEDLCKYRLQRRSEWGLKEVSHSQQAVIKESGSFFSPQY